MELLPWAKRPLSLGPNPFIDNASWRLWLKQAHEGALKYIADQKAKAAKPKASN